MDVLQGCINNYLDHNRRGSSAVVINLFPDLFVEYMDEFTSKNHLEKIEARRFEDTLPTTHLELLQPYSSESSNSEVVVSFQSDYATKLPLSNGSCPAYEVLSE